MEMLCQCLYGIDVTLNGSLGIPGKKCHNWAIKKQPPKKLPNGSYVVDFILFFIAFICLFAFKFPRSGLVQHVISGFPYIRNLFLIYGISRLYTELDNSLYKEFLPLALVIKSSLYRDLGAGSPSLTLSKFSQPTRHHYGWRQTEPARFFLPDSIVPRLPSTCP